ncbi:MAG: hypothetical protein N2504_06895 [candidate division WOR-3 bacterium]|nr:hypothetical protein [candidate division WOR-3 bacterium]MCX7948293.1 hypothetical protein [candidate division WOR-3 bacterium]MDW8151161.1 hypothetical protein [candidate division WOR-3 bacterium]
MLFLFINQLIVINGAKLEEDNKVCEVEFSKFSGAFPEEAFYSGFEFDVLNYYKIEDINKVRESIFIKANDSKFIRVLKTEDIEIYTDPESRMKFQFDTLTLNFFTRYFVVKYIKDHMCIYSFRPRKEK